MNPILVVYATREGHTKLVAEYLAERIQSVALPIAVFDIRELPLGVSLRGYAAAVIAASVHVGKHEREIVNFVRDYRTDLNQMPTAFVSVSLSQAGAQDERAGSENRAKAAAHVKRMADAFLAETQWQPTLVQPIAGALMYRKYNFLLRMIMKRIAQRADASTDTSRDHVFTAWRDLDDLVTKLVDKVAATLDSRVEPQPSLTKQTMRAEETHHQ
jgi:menaquinone-dependent protoporphyrinogen oxidase